MTTLVPSSASASASSHPLTPSSSPSTSSSFDFPSIHSFPPFYTLQPNPTSRSQQLASWRTLTLAFCRHYRIFSIDTTPTTASVAAPGVNSKVQEADVWQSLFRNQRINRSLDGQTVREVVQEMVKNGEAGWQGTKDAKPGKGEAASSKAWIYWKSPGQWADLIYVWVTATGQNKSIMTLFELTQGDLAEGQEFYDLPIPLLRQALQHLAAQGKANIFAGSETEDGEGVKFL